MPKTQNPHVWEYLTYYLSLPHSPHYAVLISGPWGVGKTYLIKEFLRQTVDKTEKKSVYVSLYGLSNIQEIDDALFQNAFPLLGGKIAKVTGRLAKAGLKYVGVDSGDLSIRDVMTNLNADLYIFDDLERCEAPINKVLGYINQFVEHDGAKVIVIANENEITNSKNENASGDEYRRRREKLIGKTLEVQSAFDDAFSNFVSKIDDSKLRKFFNKNSDEISAIYAQSELNNLRILQQTMWDFERFCKMLTPTHRKNSEAMLTLLRLIFALSFELKSARIDVDDLTNGRGIEAAVRAHLEKKKTRLMESNERYPLIDLNDTILSSEILVAYLIRGILDEQKVKECLDASRFFVTVADEPPWRTVWHWMERTEHDFYAALSEMETQFSTREYVIQGEILHVLGLRLFLSRIGILKVARAEVVKEGKQYIDDVYNRKTLELIKADHFVGLQGYGGLGIHEHETPEYQELFNHLKEKTRRAFEDTYPQKADDLLNEMKTDVELFYRHLCLTNSADNIYHSTPILASIDADRFVDELIKLNLNHQRKVMMIFKSRYEHGQLKGELKAEKEWAQSVREKLLARAETMSPISKYRIENLIDLYMKATSGKTAK